MNGLAPTPILGESSQVAQASAIVADLAKGFHSSEEVFAAFESLDSLDPDVVRAALLQWTGVSSDPDSLDDATRRAHGLPPRRLRLRTTRVVRDADILDLGRVAEEQLRVAGKSYDGLDLPAEDRLDGEREDVSFAGSLILRTLADEQAPGRSLFDVLILTDDAGLVFRAGTAEILGTIAYGIVEIADRQAREAIQHALSEPPPPEAEMVEAPAEAVETDEHEDEPHPDTLVVVAAPSVEPLVPHDSQLSARDRRQLALFDGDEAAPTPKLPAREDASAESESVPTTKKKVAKKASAKRTVKRASVARASSPARASKADVGTKTAAKKSARTKDEEPKKAATKSTKKRAATDAAPKKVSAKKATAKKATVKKATSAKKVSAKTKTVKATTEGADEPSSTTPTKKRAVRAKSEEPASPPKKRKASAKPATKKGAQQKSPGSKTG